MVEELWDSVVKSPHLLRSLFLGCHLYSLCVCLWVLIVVVSFFGGSFPPAGQLRVSPSTTSFFLLCRMCTGCVEAGSSVCMRFWGISLALVHLCVLGNFSIIWLYYQCGPAWRLVWLPLSPSPSSVVISWWFLFLWVSSFSRYTAIHSLHLLFFYDQLEGEEKIV